MTTANRDEKPWDLTYSVTADFRPYRRWIVRAEGEAEARALVSAQIGVPVEQFNATTL